VSGGGVRHQQNSLSDEQELAFVGVDPVQAFPGMASSGQWSRDIGGAGVRCVAQLNRAGPCWTFWNGPRKASSSGPYYASWHEANQAERAGHPGAGSGGLECGILQDPHRRWQVDGIVRPPFGIDQRATDQTGNRSWFVTHLPSGLAVVSQVRALAVAIALTDRIAALTDWEAQNIRATPELREQVREALDRAYGDFFANRLPAFPEDAPPVA
jgi:hypothetical protein